MKKKKKKKKNSIQIDLMCYTIIGHGVRKVEHSLYRTILKK